MSWSNFSLSSLGSPIPFKQTCTQTVVSQGPSYYYWDDENAVWKTVPVSSQVNEQDTNSQTGVSVLIANQKYTVQNFSTISILTDPSKGTVANLMIPQDDELRALLGIGPMSATGTTSKSYKCPPGNGNTASQEMGIYMGKGNNYAWTTDGSKLVECNKSGGIWFKQVVVDKNQNLWPVEYSRLAGLKSGTYDSSKKSVDYLVNNYGDYVLISGFGWIDKRNVGLLGYNNFPVINGVSASTTGTIDMKVYGAAYIKAIVDGKTLTLINEAGMEDGTTVELKLSQLGAGAYVQKVIVDMQNPVPATIIGGALQVDGWGWTDATNAIKLGKKIITDPLLLPPVKLEPTSSVHALIILSADNKNSTVFSPLTIDTMNQITTVASVSSLDASDYPHFDGYISIPGIGVTSERFAAAKGYTNIISSTDVVHQDNIFDKRCWAGMIIKSETTHTGKKVNKTQGVDLLEHAFSTTTSGPVTLDFQTPLKDNAGLKKYKDFYLIPKFGWCLGHALKYYGYQPVNDTDPSSDPHDHKLYGFLMIESKSNVLFDVKGYGPIEIETNPNTDDPTTSGQDLSLSIVDPYQQDIDKPMMDPAKKQQIEDLAKDLMIQLTKDVMTVLQTNS